MKHLLLTFLFCLGIFSAEAQEKTLVQIESNKVLSLFSFAQTVGQSLGTSPTYKNIILDAYQQDSSFQNLITDYGKIYLWDELKRENYPRKRHVGKSVEELLWIASSNANDLDDFSERIIGYLPNAAHAQLMRCLRGMEPYFEALIWDKQQAQIKRIVSQLKPYAPKIESLFMKISHFYGTDWNREVPFKVLLYPIPARNGMTTAVPMGNALICGFLSENENDYKGRLGVIIHEMCHVLYEEQSKEIQNQLDKWFKASNSEYRTLAYNYIDEGLATAIGNGWSYEQIHNEMDTLPWYNNEYIEGFARALFPTVKAYMNKGKSLDQDFVEEAIRLFGKTFPDAPRQTSILMNDLCIVSNKEGEAALDQIINGLATRFQLRSASLNSPFNDPKTKEELAKQNTKIILIDKEHQDAGKWLEVQFPKLKEQLPLDKSFLFCFKDEKNKNTVILINVLEEKDMDRGFKALQKMRLINYNKLIII